MSLFNYFQYCYIFIYPILLDFHQFLLYTYSIKLQGSVWTFTYRLTHLTLLLSTCEPQPKTGRSSLLLLFSLDPALLNQYSPWVGFLFASCFILILSFLSISIQDVPFLDMVAGILLSDSGKSGESRSLPLLLSHRSMFCCWLSLPVSILLSFLPLPLAGKYTPIFNS